MTPGEHVDLAETPHGFRCGYAFYDHAVFIQVKERQLRRDPGLGSFVAFWFTRSTVGVYFPTSRAQAQFVVEAHLSLYDNELASTLGPLWAAWDAAPTASPSEPQRLPVSQVN